ncbi:DUF58 domain-containing protein [Sediminivirga luteola]|uniref:DUF58 domain-containing protein n=1 Tax=Sediminivirga luteola TaxID=1774748 RepID=UPI001F55DFA6|nr:DUF58 domain-containing protein [Sediminivirga luteola]
MPRLLPRVRAQLALLTRRRRRLSNDLLEGDYASVFHGRSPDFDDLRPYLPGDEVRDIDWRASARHPEPLVRRRTAQRRMRLAIVAGTGAELSALGPAGTQKRDTAVLAAGMLAVVAARHGDDVLLVSGSGGRSRVSRPGRADGHLESLLQTLHSPAAEPGGPAAPLRTLAAMRVPRMLVLVIADDGPLPEKVRRLLPGLRHRHEMLWLDLADADLTEALPGEGRAAPLVDVLAGEGLQTPALPGRLAHEYRAAEAARLAGRARLLRRHGIPQARVNHAVDVPAALHRLLRGLPAPATAAAPASGATSPHAPGTPRTGSAGRRT